VIARRLRNSLRDQRMTVALFPFSGCAHSRDALARHVAEQPSGLFSADSLIESGCAIRRHSKRNIQTVAAPGSRCVLS
jgi:hypothetical protein